MFVQGKQIRWRDWWGTTTDASPGQASFSLLDDATASVEIFATARRQGADESAVWHGHAAVAVTGGAARLIGMVTLEKTADDENWNCVPAVNGQALEFTVTGMAGKTIDWLVQIREVRR